MKSFKPGNKVRLKDNPYHPEKYRKYVGAEAIVQSIEDYWPNHCSSCGGHVFYGLDLGFKACGCVLQPILPNTSSFKAVDKTPEEIIQEALVGYPEAV